jgi:rubredoxin
MAAKMRCMTCHKEFDAESPAILTRLADFEDTCICRECVDVAQKRKPPAQHDKD